MVAVWRVFAIGLGFKSVEKGHRSKLKGHIQGSMILLAKPNQTYDQLPEEIPLANHQ